MNIKNTTIRKYIDNRGSIILTMLLLSLVTLIFGEFLISSILIIGGLVNFYLLIEEGVDYNVTELNKLRIIRLFNKKAVIFRTKSENNNYYILTLEHIDNDLFVGKKLYKYFSETDCCKESSYRSQIILLDINDEIIRLKQEIKKGSFIERKINIPVFIERRRFAIAA